jgi:4-amino-4-deoxy-L-arabinose transferase-like glycosyltransferase
MLLLGRLIIASLFPLGLILLYRIGIAMDGRWLGIFTVLLFSSNALILLHTRRAMAEGTLVFGVILTLYALIFADKRPLLVGLAVAIAFNAKQSAVALLPIGLLAVCWIPEKNMRNFPLLAGNSAKYLAGFALLTALLNPFLWRQPVSAAQEALQLRQDLLERQVADYERLAPGQVLESPAERSAVLLAQLFFTPPFFSEVGNYWEFTKAAEAQYLLSPSHQLWRNPISGVILFGLAILGMVVAVRVSFHTGSAKRRLLLLYLFAFLALAVGIISMIPLPWQRYSIPLIPIITIFISLGFVWLIKNSRRIYSHGRLSARLSQVLTQFAPDSWMS